MSLRQKAIVATAACCTLIAATGVGLAVTQGTTPAVADRRAIAHEVETYTRAMAAAFSRGDLAAVANFYDDDAVIYQPSGHVIRGRRAIDRFWTRIEHPYSWTLETVQVGGSRDEPHQLVRSVLVERAGNHQSTAVTMCLLLWRREPNGRLRVQLDMYTPVPSD